MLIVRFLISVKFNQFKLNTNMRQVVQHRNNDIRKKIQDYSYGLQDNIGKGFSSVVFKGINDKTQQQVAIKVIDLKSLKDRTSKQMLQGEIDALRKLNHINIMKCFDIYNTVNNCYIITQFCNQGDLQHFLKKRGKLSQEQVIPIFRDIFLGFKYIAENGYLHRDLKPANLLIKDKIIKIADFGFSKKISGNSKEATNVGSPLYMSPQSLLHNIYTVKTDIWSLGVILYELLHGCAPWSCSTEKQLIQKIMRTSVSFRRQLSDNLKDFIKKCLTPNQQKRISLSEMSSHPFISKILEDNIPKLLRRQTNAPSEQQQIKKKQQSLQNIKKQKPTQQFASLFHRYNSPNCINKTEKQINGQINLMRFLFHLNDLFPCKFESGRYTLGLRFIINKQILCQLQTLKQCFQTGENLFHFSGWLELVFDKEKVKKYKEILQVYNTKYQQIKKNVDEWQALVTKDKTLYKIANTNFKRSQYLSIIGINFVLHQCKNLWPKLKKQSQSRDTQQLSENQIKNALYFDFLITYYQLNCLLIDNFSDCDSFARNSKIDLISETPPAVIQRCDLKEILDKFHHLEMDK